MKILQLGKFWPVLGGVEKVMFDLTKGLSERGIECDMLCAGSYGPSHEIRLNDSGRVIAIRSLLKAKSTMISPAMVTRLRRIAADYDIIHIHHPDPMAALALYLSGYTGKVVLHWHSDILRQRMLLQAYRPLQQWLLERADTVICTSPHYAKGSEALQSVAEKVTCVPIGVEPVKPSDDGAHDILRKAGARKIVFALGRMIPYKGFDNLVFAARYLPDNYAVVIAGSGPLYDPLRLLVKENGLESKVIMPGRISDSDRDTLMGAASVFCLPSVEKTEAYGIVLIEAMSAGLPVVATKIPGSGTSWVNAHGISGLNVPCHSPEKLAEAIVAVTADADTVKSYSRNARKRWESLFTIGTFIDNMTGVYRELLDSVPRAACEQISTDSSVVSIR